MAERYSYVRQPYARDERTMLDLMRLASADRSRSDLARADARAQGIRSIGDLIAGTLAGFRQERDQKAALALKAEQDAAERGMKVRDQQLREADLLDRIEARRAEQEAKALAAREKQQADAYKRGAEVAEEVEYGPMSEMQMGDVMQGPAAGRARYVFGPGTADGPELQPTQAQQRELSMRQKLEGMGYSFGPNGQVIPPQKPTQHTVTVPGPNGQPMTKLFNEEELRNGVATYRAPVQGPAPEKPSVWVSKGDQQRYVTPTEAGRLSGEGWTASQTRENPTEDERKAAGFYKRMTDAIRVMDEVEGQITAQDLYQMQSLPQEDLIGALNRSKMTEAAKRYVRAMMQFTEARLRADSGAAVQAYEYVADRQMFGKQYGETPQLATDRRTARGVTHEGLRTRAGRALPKDAPPVVLIAPDGSEKSVPADQVEHYLSLGAKRKP